MRTIPWVLAVLSVVSAAAAISVVYRNRKLYALLKPLTTVLIIGVAATAAGKLGFFQIAVAVGLVFCLLGDIFLLSDATFLPGLASFLLAHLCFIAGFVYLNEISARAMSQAWLLIPLAAYGAGVYVILAPHLGKMKLPVVVYMTAILVMAWQALTVGILLGGWGLLVAAGGVLFVLSDSTLAYNRFRRQFMPAEVIILSTYWAAILLIAIGIRVAG